jgi:hypothetical protein
MPTVLTLLFVIIIVIIVLSVAAKSPKRKAQPGNRLTKIDYSSVPMPVGLGCRKELTLEALEQRMNEALPPVFLEQLKKRVMEAQPNLAEAEYEWRLLELKRYFAMSVILRQVPMFSAAVDEIWHEMLMFTREYQQFSERIAGAMIHHTPHAQKESLPDERAWFDWVYGHLFEFTPFSNHIWDRFYRFPLSKVRLEQLRMLSKQEIYERLFNIRTAELYPEIKETIFLLIHQAKEQINNPNEPQRFERGSNFQSGDVMSYAAGAMLFCSMMDTGNYESNMNALIPENIHGQQNGAGSGCSSCGTGDSSSSNCSSDSDGSDGGSSGCSSSSSCGGGGGD